MPRPTLYAFYGSLRRGMSNHKHFAAGLKFVEETELAGYQLFEMRHYPYAVKTGNPHHTIVVELFEVEDTSVSDAIHSLELGVGYYFEEVVIHGKRAGIYLYEKAGGERLVQGGDWVKFFGARA